MYSSSFDKRLTSIPAIMSSQSSLWTASLILIGSFNTELVCLFWCVYVHEKEQTNQALLACATIRVLLQLDFEDLHLIPKDMVGFSHQEGA